MKTKEKPIFTRKGPLSSVDFIFCCLNSAISFGVLKLGAVFTSGLIMTYIILIIVSALSYFSLRLFVLAASFYHESTFEEIWRAAFPKVTLIIPITASIFSSLVNIITYLREIQAAVISIWYKILKLHKHDYETDSSELSSYKMLIGCCILIVLILPLCFTISIHSMAILSYFSMICVFIFIIYVVFMFAYLVKKVGFDPTHSIKYFQFGDQFIKSLLTLIFAFEFYPLTYPGLRDCQNSTPSSLSKSFIVINLSILIIYSVIGTFCYLTFFDQNNKGIILDYYPTNTKAEQILLIIGRIVTFFFVLCTIPFRLNSCRYIILNTFNSTTSFPPEIWTFMGIIISVFSLALSNLTNEYLNCLEVINNVMAAVLLYIIPPLLFIKAYKTTYPGLFAAAIVLLIIGFTSSISIIVYKGFY